MDLRENQYDIPQNLKELPRNYNILPSKMVLPEIHTNKSQVQTEDKNSKSKQEDLK